MIGLVGDGDGVDVGVVGVGVANGVSNGVADGDGDGDGVVNPEEPVVFDEVTVQELPHSCCVSWLFSVFENTIVNLLLQANAICPRTIIAVLSTNSSAANVATANLILWFISKQQNKVYLESLTTTAKSIEENPDVFELQENY